MKKKLLCCLSLLVFVLAAVTQAAPVLPFTTDLQLRYEADSLGQADGTDVTLWNDSDPQFDNAPLHTEDPFLAPTYALKAFNGHSAVHFWGAAIADPNAHTQTMLTTDNAVLGNWGSGCNGVCVFVVAKGGPSDREQRAFQVGRTRNVANSSRSIIADLSAYESGNRFNDGRRTEYNAFKEGQWNITIHEQQKGLTQPNSFYAINSTTGVDADYTSGSTAFDIYGTGNEALMGSITDKEGLWMPGYCGDIAEVLVYRNVLTPADKQAVFDYLYAKYFTSGAHDPVPAQNATDVGTRSGSQVTVNFGWTTGSDPNHTMAGHYLYISPNDPTFAGVTPISLPLGTTTYSRTLDLGITCYWRVDESIMLNGSPTSATDPNTFKGQLWAFDTKLAIPTFTVQPADANTIEGGSATFSVTVDSSTAVTYAWWRSPDDVLNALEPNDVLLGNNSSTYTLPHPATAADEGYYYCVATNGSEVSVKSNAAKLGVKRLVSHWSLDSGAIADGKYVDDIGHHDADPNIFNTNVDMTAFVAGKTGDALDVGNHHLAAAMTTDQFIPTFQTGEVTVAGWVKFYGATGTFQAVCASRNIGISGGNWNFLVEVRPSGELQLVSQLDDNLQVPLAVGEWVHFAATASSARQVMYLNGEVAAIWPTPQLPKTYQILSPFFIGCVSHTSSTSGVPLNAFNGVIDDLKVWNYAMTQMDIINAYGLTNVCLRADAPDDFDMDVSGPSGTPDCKVNLYDFAKFASTWLNCGLYPASGCL